MDPMDQLQHDINFSDEVHVQFDLLIKQAWEVITINQGEAHRLLDEARVCYQSMVEPSPFATADMETIEAILLVGKDQYLDALSLAIGAYKRYWDAKHQEGLARVFRVLSLVYGHLGRMEDAIKASKDGLEIIKSHQLKLTENGGIPLEFIYRNNIATIYTFLDRSQEALEQYKAAMALIDASSHIPWVLICTNLGITYVDVGEVDLGIDYIQKSLDLVHEKDLGPRMAQMCHHGLGRVYKSLKRFDEALNQYTLALSMAEMGGSKFDQLDTLVDLISMKIVTEQPLEAFAYLDQAIAMGEELQTNNLLCQAHHLKAQCHEMLGEAEKALLHYKRYMELRQNLSNQQTETLMSTFSMEYQVEKAHQDAEILRMKTISLEESHRNLMILSGIGRDITSSLDIGQVVQKVYKSLSLLMQLNVFAIAMYDQPVQELDFIVLIENGDPQPARRVALGDFSGYAGQCIQSREAILLNGLDKKDFNNYIATNGDGNKSLSQSIIYHPLILGDEVIGVITVQSYNAQVYSENELEMIRILGTYIAIGLNNSQKSEALQAVVAELEIASTTDHLTGLYNRRFMMQQLEREYVRFQRYERPFSIMIADLDHFKAINDTYGHDLGDIVLKEVAALMKNTLRRQDFLARWGGEEFLILMPETTSVTALMLAERLRTLIMSHAIGNGEAQVYITMTFGMAEYRKGLSLEETIKCADNGLYLGKQNGRNRCVAEQELS